MGGGLYKEMARGAGEEIDKNARWLACESAIVADVDDPDKQHRIKVIIPSIDEDNAYDDWVRPLTPFALGDGFGSVFLPPIGSEVLISGVLGQKYNLVYFGAVYNEEAAKPAELDVDTPGIKVPKNLSFLVGLLLKLQAQNARVIIEQLHKLTAQNIESLAEQLNKITGQNIESLAEQLNKITGQNIELTAGSQIQINGNTITINSDGSMTIHSVGPMSIQGGANVAVTAAGVLTLEGRTVNKVGPAI